MLMFETSRQPGRQKSGIDSCPPGYSGSVRHAAAACANDAGSSDAATLQYAMCSGVSCFPAADMLREQRLVPGAFAH